jgi:hypothetical protein
MVACGHDVHRWEKLTDQDADDRNHNAAGHCIQLIVPQFVLKLADFEAGFGIVRGGHDLSPSSQRPSLVCGHTGVTLLPPL